MEIESPLAVLIRQSIIDIVSVYSLSQGLLAKYALNQKNRMPARKDARDQGISQNVGPPVDLGAVSLEAPSENVAEALMCSQI